MFAVTNTTRFKRFSKTRKTINTAIFAETLGGPPAQILINGGLLSLFILALGGDKFAVGVAYAMHFFGLTIRIFVAPHADVVSRKKMVIIWFLATAAFFACFFAAYPVSRIFGNRVAVWYVIGVYFAGWMSMNIAATALLPWITDLIPRSLRGRFFAQLLRSVQIVSFVMIVLIGWYLGETPPIKRFYAVFGVLLAMVLICPLLFARLPEVKLTRTGAPESIFINLKYPLRDKAFRTFLIFWAAVVFTVNMARPFAVPFLKEDLGFPSSVTLYATAGFLIGMVLGLMPWGRMADKHGNRIVFLFNIILMVLAFNILALTPGYSIQPVVSIVVGISAFVLMGISVGGLSVGHLVRQTHAAPAKHRGAYMGLFFAISGISAGITSTLTGAVLNFLPESMSMFEISFSPIRIFLPGVSILVLCTLLLLRRIEPLSEKPMRYIITNFIALLPPTLTVPLRLITPDTHDNSSPNSR